MIEILIVVVIVGTAVWVYLDATKNKVGKIPGEKGLWNMSAGNWAASTLILWIVGFPVYLVKRPALLKRAEETPIDPKNRALGVFLVVVAGVLLIGYTLMA